MRISRKSPPRRSDAFRSRFLEAGKAAAPIRQTRQLREHLAGESVLFVLQLGFLVALVFFGRSLVNLFERHGAALNPWYLRLSLLGVLVCFVLVTRRVITRGRELRDTRRDLTQARRALDDLRDAVRRGDDY